MSEPFIGEIRLFGCNFAPRGWANCAGQLIPISQNTALFSLLGTYYGGNGQSNFALPNLQGTVPVGQGQGPGLQPWQLGEQQGSETVTLLSSEMPAHAHALVANSAPGNVSTPENGQSVLSRSTGGSAYSTASTGLVQLAPTTLSPTGGSQPHNNLQPYLVMNWCIAMQGVFPSRP
ncbi:MAG: tail fiber protein [Patulibacter minatonensis]